MSDPLSTITSATTSTVGTTLKFPHSFEGKSGNWIMFSRIKYQRPSLLGPSTVTPSGATIALPVPPQLATTYSAQWENQDLGFTAPIVAGFVNGVADRAMAAKKAGGSAFQSVVNEIQNTGNIMNAGLSYVKAAALDAGLKQDVAAIAGMSMGFARNPHKATVFSAPGFRNFNFTYKLVAKSSDESDVIRSIIKEFKTAMLPAFVESFENNLFEYPDMYQISFTHSGHLFKIGNCILREVGVDYHAEGTPAYFGKNGHKIPVSINLNLAFQEAEILTREKVESQGY